METAAARGIGALIAKMDDGEAEVFTRMLVGELYDYDVRSNQRLLRSADTQTLDLVAKSLLNRLERGEDPEEVVAIAAAVGIAKADNAWEYQDRDALGRWGHMNRHQYRARVSSLKAQGKVQRADLKAARHSLLAGQAQGAQRVGSAAARTAQDFSGDWNRAPNQARSGATEGFRRLESGGKLAQQIGVGANRPAVALAGTAARYVGQFGPEAEKVIGPHLRRTTYRYRGTERTPDLKELNPLIQRQATDINRAEGRELGITSQKVTLADGTTKTVRTRNEDPVKALDHPQRVYATEQAAVRYFIGNPSEGRPTRIPKASRAELQRKSGRITPSEGILIDASGKITHQAIGFGEDHYLPFNLKNLGDLKGGSYVRTRESGGLSTEDLYAGLMSGARAMTVVSNSGVFTIEFDDTLRGGRRYNDKAKQMVQRYASTLDTIKSEQVSNPARQISPRRKAEIKYEIANKINNDPSLEIYSQNERDRMVDEDFSRAMSKPQISDKQENDLRRSAKAGAKDDKEADYIFRQLREEALEHQANTNYRLDGEGYTAAMEALKEQFPYYIADVSYQTKDRVEGNTRTSGILAGMFNSSIDSGYVKPKFIRPEGALSGYYDSSITGRGKTSADRTLYQNARVSRTEGQPPQPASQPASRPAPSSSERSSAEQAAERARVARTRNEENRKRAEFVGRDAAGWQQLHENDPGSGVSARYETMHEFFASDEDARRRMLDNPDKVNALAREMDEADLHYQPQDPPSNRKIYQTQVRRRDVAETLHEDHSPVSPPSLAASDKDVMLAHDQTARTLAALAAKDDSWLKEASDKLRNIRSQKRDAELVDEIPALDRDIQLHEAARAVRADRPEYTADEYQQKLDEATASGSLQPVPKVTTTPRAANATSIQEHFARIEARWRRGYYDKAGDARKEVSETLQWLGDDMEPEHRKRVMDQFLEHLSGITKIN